MNHQNENFENMSLAQSDPNQRYTPSLCGEVVLGTGEIIADGTSVVANRAGETSDITIASDIANAPDVGGATDAAMAAGAVGLSESVVDGVAEAITEVAADGAEAVSAGVEVVASGVGEVLSGVGDAIGDIISGIFDAL